MRYSIIIPHFNDFERLNRLIKSIPARKDIEIIVIDDNSDKEPIISSFSNYNISIFINNSGVQSAGACRNIGLKKATGKWLLFADSDDIYMPNAFDIMDENVDEKYEIIYFSPTSLDFTTEKTSDRHIPYEKLVKSFLRSGNCSINYFFYVPWSKLILGEFVKNHSIKFDEVIASNDVMFSLRAGVNAKHIKAVDENVYCVTKRVGSLTSLSDNEMLRVRFEVSLQRNDFLFQWNLKSYQASVYSLLKKYRKIIDFKCFLILLKKSCTGKIIIFPVTFKGYIKSPSTIYERFSRK